MARRHRGISEEGWLSPPLSQPDTCWLCGRLLGRRIEWHHPLPKSRGGRATVPVHPICHRTLHARFTNLELARQAETGIDLKEDPAIARFLAWIANKPPDFNAPTRKAH